MSEASEGHVIYGTLGMNQNGSAARVSIDWDTKAVATIDTPHYHIHQDEAFSHFFSASADAGASGNMFFITGADESHFRMVGLSTKADQLWFKLYESHSASGISTSSGWSASAFSTNRDRRSNAQTANIKWYTPSGVVSNASSTEIDQHFVGGGTNQGAAKSGGTQSADEEWELKPSTVYLINWVNKSSAANEFNARFFHYDIDIT